MVSLIVYAVIIERIAAQSETEICRVYHNQPSIKALLLMTHSLTNNTHASDCSVPPTKDIAYGNNKYHGGKWEKNSGGWG